MTTDGRGEYGGGGIQERYTGGVGKWAVVAAVSGGER